MKSQVLLVLLHCVLCIDVVAAERPNIILVMADDQGWGDMGYNGHPLVKTPNFDEAARTGLRFDRFYAAAPVCSPTRASVMTGRHPNRMGVFKWGYPMRPQEETLPEILSRAGYSTAHFGKWHLGSVRNGSPASPGENGFDHWISAPNFFDNNPILSSMGRAVKTQGESSMVTVDAALDWIEKQTKTEQPFFVAVWFGSPHSPHRAAEQDLALYTTTDTTDGLNDKQKKQRRNRANFLGEVTGMDRAFGKLRGRLTELGIRDNTILWYTSDNGALPRVGSAGGFRGKKGNVYEGGLLVTAILEWPDRIKQPRSTSVRCNSSDILPTLVSITGAARTNRSLDGINLVPLIEDQMSKRNHPMGFWDRTAKGISVPSAKLMKQLLDAQQRGEELAPNQVSQRAAELPEPKHEIGAYPGHSAWIDGDWKLHRLEKNGSIEYQLYDLVNDKAESNNLANNQPDRVQKMNQELEQWLESVVRSYNGEDY